jgi:hypothetical protein
MTNTLRFGDKVLNTAAGDNNPRRIGIFIRWVYRTGRLNPGKFAECTDGNGDIWRTWHERVQKCEVTP